MSYITECFRLFHFKFRHISGWIWVILDEDISTKFVEQMQYRHIEMTA